MGIVGSEGGSVRTAPMEGGPEVEVLVAGSGAESGSLTAACVVVAPGGGMLVTGDPVRPWSFRAGARLDRGWKNKSVRRAPPCRERPASWLSSRCRAS